MANSQDVDLVTLDVVPNPIRADPPPVLSGLGEDNLTTLVRLLANPP